MLDRLIPAGGDYAYTLLTPEAAGAGTLTASTSGLASANTLLTVQAAPVSVNLTAAQASTPLPVPVSVRLTASLLGSPVVGANVTFSSNSGTMTPASGVTDVTGGFTSLFLPNQLGAVTITAVVHHPLLGNTTVTTTVLVISPSVTQKASSGGSLGLLLIILPVVIIVAFLGALVFFMRRTLKARRAKAEEEGEDQV